MGVLYLFFVCLLINRHIDTMSPDQVLSQGSPQEQLDCLHKLSTEAYSADMWHKITRELLRKTQDNIKPFTCCISQTIQSSQAHHGIRHIALSNDGKFLIIAFNNELAEIWDLTTNNLTLVIEQPVRPKLIKTSIKSVAISNDNNYAYIVYADRLCAYTISNNNLVYTHYFDIKFDTGKIYPIDSQTSGDYLLLQADNTLYVFLLAGRTHRLTKTITYASRDFTASYSAHAIRAVCGSHIVVDNLEKNTQYIYVLEEELVGRPHILATNIGEDYCIALENKLAIFMADRAAYQLNDACSIQALDFCLFNHFVMVLSHYPRGQSRLYLLNCYTGKMYLVSKQLAPTHVAYSPSELLACVHGDASISIIAIHLVPLQDLIEEFIYNLNIA